MIIIWMNEQNKFEIAVTKMGLTEKDIQDNQVILERVLFSEFSPGAAAKLLREIGIDNGPVGEIIKFKFNELNRKRDNSGVACIIG